VITHLVDTDVVADYLGDRRGAIDLLQPLIREERLAISFIAYAEIYDGILGSNHLIERIAAFKQFLQGVTLVGLDQDTGESFARVRFDLRSRGEPIPDHDVWIAATAISRDLILVSRDHHFDRIGALRRA
jgi:predicted nucleic acid-binding protein